MTEEYLIEFLKQRLSINSYRNWDGYEFIQLNLTTDDGYILLSETRIHM